MCAAPRHPQLIMLCSVWPSLWTSWALSHRTPLSWLSSSVPLIQADSCFPLHTVGDSVLTFWMQTEEPIVYGTGLQVQISKWNSERGSAKWEEESPSGLSRAEQRCTLPGLSLTSNLMCLAFVGVDEAEGRNRQHCVNVCPLCIFLKQQTWLNICAMIQKG